MRRRPLVAALLATAATLAAACSPPASDPEAKASASATSGSDGGLVVENPSASASASGTPTAGPSASASAKAQAARARETAKNAPGVKTFAPNVPKGGFTYQGVTDKTITLAFHWNRDSCGFDINERLTNGFSSDPEKAITAYVDFINRNADKGVLIDGYPIKLYGRRIVPAFVSSGGGDPSCADRARAAGTRIAKEIKAFAGIGSTLVFDEDIVGTEVAKNKVMYFGHPFGSESRYYADKDPYVWSLYSSGSIMVKHLADYMTQRLVKQSPPGHERYHGKRVYGLLHPDTAGANQLASEFKAALGGKIRIASEFSYDQDFSSAQSQSTSAVARFRGAGVNTIVMLTDPIAPIVFTSVAQQQQYSPDYLVSSYGYMDIATAAVNFDTEQTRHFFGVSDFGPESQGSVTDQKGRPFYRDYTSVRSDEPPSDAVAWYATLASAIWGISAAGPNLTPATVKAGLLNQVNIFRPTNYRIDFVPGRHGAIDDYGLVRYDPDAVDMRDEPSSTGKRRGKYVFYECSKPIPARGQCPGTPRRYRTNARL